MRLNDGDLNLWLHLCIVCWFCYLSVSGDIDLNRVLYIALHVAQASEKHRMIS